MKSALIRAVDPELFRKFKAIAVLRGITLSQAFNEAVELWIDNYEKSLSIKGEFDKNNEFFNRVKKELDRKYRGKYVLIANGDIVAVVNNVKEAYEVLKKKKLRRCLIHKVGVERERGEWLWGSIEL